MAAPFHFEYAARIATDTETDQLAEKDEEIDPGRTDDVPVPVPAPPSSSSSSSNQASWTVRTILFILIVPLLPILFLSTIEASHHPGLSLPDMVTSWTRSFHRHAQHQPRKERPSPLPSSQVDLDHRQLFEPIDPSRIDYPAMAPYLDPSDSANTTSSTSSLASDLTTIHTTTTTLTHLILTSLPCALLNSSSSSSTSTSTTIPHLHSLTTTLSTTLLSHQKTHFDNTPSSHRITAALANTARTLAATRIERGSWGWFAARHLHVIPYWPGGALTAAEEAHAAAERAHERARRAGKAYEDGREAVVEARARVDGFAGQLEELWRIVGGRVVRDGAGAEGEGGGHEEGKGGRLVGDGGEDGWLSRGGGGGGVKNDLADEVAVWYFDKVARRVGMSWDVFEIWWQDLSCAKEEEEEEEEKDL